MKELLQLNDTDEQRRADALQRNAIFLSGLGLDPFRPLRHGNKIQKQHHILDVTEIPYDGTDEWLM